MLQLQIVVTGKVQGVGYRYYAQMMAVQHGITGWVRNRPDGSVEMLTSGTKENLDLFLKEIRSGSPFSSVDEMRIEEKQHKERYNSFTIKY
ncbi:acylphosphatase [Bacillus sp. FJAT-27251]|uniref:acylphosphatase n=1 Tax=Bacillus sp. FJAT-27251 TaxID=1684142 RepID=UPI0006A7F08B|nr:acylphosphatase [Bacillus sp. FJAT-27251]